jgi:heme/copper-type cytochrome/quinol oxidase subunit 2
VRVIALLVCGSIALLVFLTMLRAIACHRARLYPNRAYGATAIAEYVWAAIPWLMIVACALPAVRLIVAGPD